MLDIKKCHDDLTGTMLVGMKNLLFAQMRSRKLGGIATTKQYRMVTLPTGNYGIAFIDIDTLSDSHINQVFYAHSKIGNPDAGDFSADGIKFTPLKSAPNLQRFPTLWVKNDNGNELLYNGHGRPTSPGEEYDADEDDYYDRKVCTESKILEYIHSKVGENGTVEGTIHMFTERYPCRSCMGVLKEFVKLYQKINVTVYYEMKV
ncbi:deaminase domain-containing protein [Priestia megaterium]|uniref:deaminase domain-containing protein n=1 Tax=Priestia megaterium TaxID=1404 RepID=UPI000BFCE3A0|nr:deaminase domain-containing protein [Priestia megaterium]PGN04347.1 hypothetical protein CN955_21495 [Priestia megaterium]